MRNISSQQGFGILGAVMMMVTLALLVGAVVHSVASGQVTRVNHLMREQAFYNVQAGIEYALRQIASGVDPNNVQKDFAGGNFRIAYNAQSGAATISAGIPGFLASSSSSYTVQLPVLLTEADCLVINKASASLNGAANQLQGLTMRNNCNVPINVDSMQVSWTPVGTEKLNTIRFQGSNVYSSANGLASGVLADIRQSINVGWWPIPVNTTHTLDYLAFSSSMLLKNFTLRFVMKDGSAKSVFVQFLADNQAACLQVNTAQLSIGGSNYRDYLGATLRNGCNFSLSLSKITVAWTPLNPAREFQQMLVDNVTLWSGTASSGEQKVLNTAAQAGIAAGQTRAQTRLRFDSDMRGRNLVVTYTMSDNTSLAVNYNLYAQNMASCLLVNAALADLSSNKKDIRRQTWKNTCPLGIVVDKVQSSWAPLLPLRTLTQIRIESQTVSSGVFLSGIAADIDDVHIPAGSTFEVDRYRFSDSMTGRCLSHVMTMVDGSSLNVGSFCPQ